MGSTPRCPQILLCSRLVAPRNYSSPQARSFSASCRRSKKLPTFNESSNPELQSVLKTIRERIIIPGYLNKAQQKLMRDASKAAMLEMEDVRVVVGGEEVKLRHINIMKDVPRRWTVFNSALSLTQKQQDWDNWPALLIGFNVSKAHLRPEWLERFVRKAVEARQVPMLLYCLSRVKESGLSLRFKGVRENVMMGIRTMAKESDWEEEETKRCLARAQKINEIMEFDGHCGGERVSRNDPRSHPLMIAIPLELATMLAIRYSNGQDVDGQIRTYTRRLLAALEQQVTELDETESTSDPEQNPLENKFVRNIWRVIHGSLDMVSKEGVLEDKDLERKARDAYERIREKLGLDMGPAED